ncbi:MAG TPA: M67 family metallopeptidase [Acidimicrobiales bacterium]|nr:M67 family metallopeptidase [Acidimicrobiales bacterium]
MLALAPDAYDAMVAHCITGAPLEACGLLVGRPAASRPAPGSEAPPATDSHAQVVPGLELQTADPDPVVRIELCLPARNAAASARVYTVEPVDLLRADRRAEAEGAEVMGVYHSHTHTEAYPSPTDVAQAPDPSWHYVLVSLRDTEPTVRSYRIRDGRIEEEPVAVLKGANLA